MSLVRFLINFLILPALFATAWDIAVITKQDIEFFRNGSALGVGHGYLKDLSVGAYDPVHGYLYVSDASHPNTSIFRVNTQSVKDDIDPSAITFQPIISKQASVQGMAFDPLTATLFWTTGGGNTILKYTFHEKENANSISQHPGTVLHAFEDGSIPRGITVDSCRKTIYWTNIKPLNASIEKSNFNGSERTVIVPVSLNGTIRLYQPYGIIVDQKSNHLYWCDAFEDNSYQIVRSNLDGGDAKIVINHSGQEPYGLTIAGDRLYWTDQQYGSLYSLPLISSDRPNELTTLVKKFGLSVRPDGVISNTLYLNLKTDLCPGMELIKTQIKQLYRKESPMFSPSQRTNATSANDNCLSRTTSQCLNNGKLVDGVCKCTKGYKGVRCEHFICYNYCLNGSCEIDQDGLPSCKCVRGWSGTRCEVDRCQNVCFNNGRCVIKDDSQEPVCECAFGFSGRRCEFQTDMMKELCKVYCAAENVAKRHYLSEETIHSFKSVIDSISQESLHVCSCPEVQSPPVNVSAELLHGDEEHADSKLSEHNNVALIVVLAASCVFLGGLVVFLSTKVLKLRKRPRIRKRIVVNRPSIPFCRPPAARDQCEITIENCCNMNICETPCFEPDFRSSRPTFSNSKSEDKKNLITSMYSNSSLDDENQ